MNKSIFTVYYKDGQRKVLTEDQFTNRSHESIEWFDEGMTRTHYYDQQWIKYEPKQFHVKEEFVLSKPLVKDLLQKHIEVSIEFNTKDMLIIKQHIGHYAFGWVEAIEVVFGEYHKGTYSVDSDNEENEWHYMTYGTEYFHVDDIDTAVAAFIKRAIATAYTPSGLQSLSIKEIAQQQEI